MKSLVFIAAIVLAVSPFAPSASSLSAAERPNIILVYADDISARELPIDGSSVWSKPDKGDTAGPRLSSENTGAGSDGGRRLLGTGRDESELGYVSSPSADELARQGVLFTRAYCNSPGCAPSRTSMHFGMYPHHCGQYGFESSHQSADFLQADVAEVDL